MNHSLLVRIQGGLGLFSLLLCFIHTSPGWAQSRYSVNVIGYADVRLAAGSNLVCNPLQAQDNSVARLFEGLPDGSFLLPWESLTRTFGPTNSFEQGAGWTDNTATMLGHDAAFLWVPEAATIHFVGSPWPRFCVDFQTGPSVSPVLPLYSCALCLDFTEPCLQVPDGTIIFLWNTETQSFDTSFLYVSAVGWLDASFSPAMPQLNTGEAALIEAPSTIDSVLFPGPSGAGAASTDLIHLQWDGTAFSFEFWIDTGLEYIVRRSTDLNSEQWSTIQIGTGPSGGQIVRVIDANPPIAGGFYRLDALQLSHPRREGTTFRFQFYAEGGVEYAVQRSASIVNSDWQTVAQVTGPPGGSTVTALDDSALQSAAYYRVEY